MFKGLVLLNVRRHCGLSTPQYIVTFGLPIEEQFALPIGLGELESLERNSTLDQVLAFWKRQAGITNRLKVNVSSPKNYGRYSPAREVPLESLDKNELFIELEYRRLVSAAEDLPKRKVRQLFREAKDYIKSGRIEDVLLSARRRGISKCNTFPLEDFLKISDLSLGYRATSFAELLLSTQNEAWDYRYRNQAGRIQYPHFGSLNLEDWGNLPRVGRAIKDIDKLISEYRGGDSE
jgi:hypothetical protein